WFALHDKALPAPKERLVAVLVKKGDKGFGQLETLFEPENVVEDGFHARRDNLAIFCEDRLDQEYATLKQFNQEKLRPYEREQILKGRFVLKDSKSGQHLDENEVATLHGLTLLQKSLEDDGERATVGHDGTRQLLVASGIAPRTVILPEWIQF